jgi:hypothetical protein
VASVKLLIRLRKLLALARSGNVHEAASARTKADEYMARHGLTEADASVAGEDEVVEVSLGSKGFETPWKFKLATVAARSFRCEALGLRVGERRKVRLVGVRDEVARAAELFRLLEREVLRVARAELAGVVARIRMVVPKYVRLLSERYLRYFREGLVDGLAASLLGRGRSRGGVSVASTPENRVEGLVRATPSSNVRERLVSSGVRVMECEESDYEPDVFDELAEAAYRSGFRQSSDVRTSVEGSST